jgi:hypothetical protein
MELNMAKKSKKISTTSKAPSKVTTKTSSKKEPKVVVRKASLIDELGLNKIQAKTITTMFTKEKMSPYSISNVTGIPRRKVMRTLEIQNLKNYSVGSYK